MKTPGSAEPPPFVDGKGEGKQQTTTSPERDSSNN